MRLWCGSDWLWLMDDDAEPREDCLKKLMAVREVIKNPVAVLTPIKIDPQGNIQTVHRGYIRKDRWETLRLTEEEYRDGRSVIKIDYSSFVGPLIKKTAISLAGFPDKDFFIWSDDVEYCCRLSQYGGVYLVKDAIIVHKDAKLENRIGEKSTDLWKWYYYGRRNRLFLYSLC